MRKVTFILSIIIGLLAGAPAMGQSSAATGDTNALRDLSDQKIQLEAFLDGLVAAGMEEYHLPGVVISVVQGDRVLLSKGWGYSNVISKSPVDPQQTLFRIGSISKTMTFTAAMQLVEQGQLDLTANLTKYLPDVRIEPKFGELNMTHLMTHTPGYEDTYLGHFIAADQLQDYAPADYLNDHAPSRVRAPGLVTSYSNYGVALAGHVIANITGETFEEVMEQQVFAPLGMSSSSFREYFPGGASYHLDEALAERRAQPYVWSRGAFEPIDEYHMHRGMAPAGSVVSTGADMARWMRAHLNDGQLEGQAILQPETHALMHEVAFSNAAGMAGNAHGFWANQINGYETREHGGAIFGFLSNMVLLPELNLGIFISTNGDNGRHFVMSIPEQVVDHFYPAKTTLPARPPKDFSAQAAVYSGQYQGNRRGFTGMDKALSLGSSVTTVSVDTDGYLYTESAGEVDQWMPLGAHLFAHTQSGRILGFRMGDGGQATQLFGYYGHSSAERIPFWRSDPFAIAVIAGASLLALLTLIGAWFRRHERIGQKPTAIRASRLLALGAVSWLVFLGGMAYWVSSINGALPSMLYEFPDQTLVVVQWLGALAALITLGCLLLLPSALMEKKWRWGRRLRHTVVLAGFVMLTLVLWDWRLIGFQY